MPGGDRTGPFGAGPMMGRGSGFCGGNDVPGHLNSLGEPRGTSGQSGIRSAGRGRGFRHWSLARCLSGWMRTGGGVEVSGTDEIDFLKKRSEYLGRSLAEVNARISELEKKG